MIWLKKEHNLFGYVPQLDKEYSEEEIRTINSHCNCKGWCNLAKLIMMTQGISFEYDGGLHMHPRTNVMPLNMVRFNFDFECLPKPRTVNDEKYLKDIHDVFTHLTMHKVMQKEAQKVYEEITITKAHWSYFVTETTINDLWYDFNRTIEQAGEAVENLKKLEEAFLRSGLDYPNVFTNDPPRFNYKSERTSDLNFKI